MQNYKKSYIPSVTPPFVTLKIVRFEWIQNVQATFICAIFMMNYKKLIINYLNNRITQNKNISRALIQVSCFQIVAKFIPTPTAKIPRNLSELLLF